ncbi:MAG: hypothetical protein AAF581_01775 [Planctomycetota bacterium]
MNEPLHTPKLQFRGDLEQQYPDVLPAAAKAALQALAVFNDDSSAIDGLSHPAASLANSAVGADPIPRPGVADTSIDLKVQKARDEAFVGSAIPEDLQRQWIQETGPAARVGAPTEKNIRNVYALLSGADGWMSVGGDALGQVSTLSLDN